MVDLGSLRAAALAAMALLAGCSVAPRPVSVAAPVPQASNPIRHQMLTALQSGDPARLTRGALALARMGGGMSDHGFGQFSGQLDRAILRDAHAPRLEGAPDPVEALRQWFHANAAPLGNGNPEPATEVPAKYRIVEGIAYDKATGRLFVGSVVDGWLAYLQKGQWHDVPIGYPRGGLFGMAVDPRRRLLWIATGEVEETAARTDPLAGLIALDLDRLTVVDRLRVRRPQSVPGDVTVGRDGTVYLSDSKTGAIQRHRPGDEGLVDLVPPGRFENPQGMAVSRDGRSLYVADYRTGLWCVRLHDGRVTPIRTLGPMMLDGIDGLVRLPRWNALLVVQNGTVPRRVVELFLSRDGTRIEHLEPLEIVPGEAGDPSLGTLRDGALWFVGDGQWERYGPRGTLKDGKPSRPTPILKIDVDQIVLTAH